MAPHPNVLPKPLFIVTLRDRYGDSDRVCGFIVEYFPGGNLADAIFERNAIGTLHFRDQLRWAQQLTSTLIFINQGPAKFYSELKTDNVLLSTKHDSEDIVFIDFEQAGNWMDFTAPEINCLNCLGRLAKGPDYVPEANRTRYLGLARANGINSIPKETLYSNPENGYFQSWKILSPTEMEAAEVYSLGMMLWCIFERVPCNRNSMSKGWGTDDLHEFPEFRYSPQQMQDLILRCTRGYKSWSLDGGLVRRGAKFFPRGKSGLPHEPTATASETREAAMIMWQQWLNDMEVLLLARKRWLNGEQSAADIDILGFPARPTLQQVLDELDNLSTL